MRAIVALIAALVVLTPASAQDGPPADWRLGQGRETFVRDSPATPQVRIDIGWNGSLIAWRWNPIRVHLTGGERPVGGQVVVEHTGGGGDAVRIGAPYGVAPGSTTTVEALVPASSYIDHLVVVITDENGRQLRRIAYADWREPSTTPPPVQHSVTQVGARSMATRKTRTPPCSRRRCAWRRGTRRNCRSRRWGTTRWTRW